MLPFDRVCIILGCSVTKTGVGVIVPLADLCANDQGIILLRVVFSATYSVRCCDACEPLFYCLDENHRVLSHGPPRLPGD